MPRTYKFQRQKEEYNAHSCRLCKLEQEIARYSKIRSLSSFDQDNLRFLETKVRRMKAQLYLV